MTKVASCTILIQAPMVVKTTPARVAEGCRCKEVGSATLNLERLRLDEQKRGVKSQPEFGNSQADCDQNSDQN